jgi:hypothetical protein
LQQAAHKHTQSFAEVDGANCPSLRLAMGAGLVHGTQAARPVYQLAKTDPIANGLAAPDSALAA